MSEVRSRPQRCRLCAEPIAAGAKICKSCKAPQVEYVQCDHCGEYMPKDARRCNRCQLFRGRFFRLTNVSHTTLLVVSLLVTVLGNVLPKIADFLNRHSDTSVAFVTASDTAITLSVANTGRRDAVIKQVRLTFDSTLGLAPAELEMDRAEAARGASIVKAGASETVHFAHRGLSRLRADTDLQNVIDTSGALVTLEIVIQESDGEETHRQTIDAERLGEFILNHTAGGPR